METQYFKEYSPAMGQDMELKVYGHAGKPILFIPCQDGRFYDFENFGMADCWAPWIESGQCMVFSIDTIDKETWSNTSADPRWRIERYEQWIAFITQEIVPFARDMVNQRNGWTGYPGLAVYGASLGAIHAANLFFRFPDLFDGMLALSGIYTASYGFGDYMDDLVYMNSPVDALGGMPNGHPFIEQYNRHKGIIVVGTGPWEIPETTFQLRDICAAKDIHVWFDIWGSDSAHDWDWWFKQCVYHLPHLLEG